MMGSQINKILICGYASLYSVRHKGTEQGSTKEILVIEVGALGDCIMNLGVLRELARIYSQEMGYRISVVCEESMAGFFEDNLPKETCIIPVHVKHRWPDFSCFKKAVHNIGDIRYRKCITLTSQNWGDWLSLCVKADEKSALTYNLKGRKQIQQAVIIRNNDILQLGGGGSLFAQFRAIVNGDFG